MQTPTLVLAAAIGALAFLPRVGATQIRDTTATLVVQVVDTADAPVALAEVVMRRAKVQATSGPTGRVVLRNISPGLDTLLVRRLGYVPLQVVVRFRAGETLTVDVVLDAKVFALEEIAVVGRPGLTTFERRMRNAIFSPPNSFYPPEALDTFPPDILVREILFRSGILLRPTEEYDERGRPFLGKLRLTCPKDHLRHQRGYKYPPVVIVLNGVIYPDPDDQFFNIVLARARIRALEIYRNSLEVPLDLPGEVTGKGCVVVVWAK